MPQRSRRLYLAPFIKTGVPPTSDQISQTCTLWACIYLGLTSFCTENTILYIYPADVRKTFFWDKYWTTNTYIWLTQSDQVGLVDWVSSCQSMCLWNTHCAGRKKAKASHCDDGDDGDHDMMTMIWWPWYGMVSPYMVTIMVTMIWQHYAEKCTTRKYNSYTNKCVYVIIICQMRDENAQTNLLPDQLNLWVDSDGTNHHRYH